MTFVTLEGPDGAGKSTLSVGIKRELESMGFSVVALREPGSTPVGERVRAILLDPAVGALDPMTEALLFSACRSELVRTAIRPALAAGSIVLLDRYFDSTMAYQGAGGGADPGALEALALAATGGLIPDLTLVVDVSPNVSARRRLTSPDRMEAKDHAYRARVRESFLSLPNRRPGRAIVLNGESDREALVAESVAEIIKRIPRVIP